MRYNARFEITRSPRTAGGCIQHSSPRRREADHRIGKVANPNWPRPWELKDADSKAAELSVNSLFLAAKHPWLQHQFCSPLGLDDLPFIVGRRPAAGEELPPWQPDLEVR